MQWRSKAGNGGHAPRGAGLEGASAHFLQQILSRNLDQSMLKNEYFFGKNVKSLQRRRISSGGWRLRN